jgi:hypothetical protein
LTQVALVDDQHLVDQSMFHRDVEHRIAKFNRLDGITVLIVDREFHSSPAKPLAASRCPFAATANLDEPVGGAGDAALDQEQVALWVHPHHYQPFHCDPLVPHVARHS